MRELIIQFIKICKKKFSIKEPIYEFGSLQVPGQEGFADLRSTFPGKKYIGADIREGPGVDAILDLHKIDLPSNTAGTVLILDTLEHVEYIRDAIKESHRILKPNGILIISSVMNFPIHSYPNDYWRFTMEAFKSLLKPFNFSCVDFAGEKNFPHTIIGIGSKGKISNNEMNNFSKDILPWKKYWSIRKRSGFNGVLEEFIPPIFLRSYYRMRKNMDE